MGAVTGLVQPEHLLHPAREPEDAGAARRQLRKYCASFRVADALLAKAELALTEIVTNIVRHAGGLGHVLMRVVEGESESGIEIIGVDRGPGIEDLARATGGRPWLPAERPEGGAQWPPGLGAGLSSVQRLASEFDLHSRAGQGTVVLARFLDRASATTGYRIGGVSIAVEGFGNSCGDGWAVAGNAAACSIVVVDGLGHGPDAHAAAARALEAFREHYSGDLVAYMRAAHEAMRATRGGALAACRIDPLLGKAHFAGIGNIEGHVILKDRTHGLVSRNGTAGLGMSAPAIKVMEYPWEPGAALLMHSDGIRSHFDVAALRSVLPHDPAVAAALVHRDHYRGRDDATVVVVRDARG